jgi:hypothetical protein
MPVVRTHFVRTFLLGYPTGGELVDRKKLPYTRKVPPYLVYNVPVGSHQVQLQKPGYRTDPESLPATLGSGGSRM